MFRGFGNLLENKKAAIYIRVSTLTQVKEGNGLDIQLARCKNVCELKRFDVYKIYTDEGVSGTTNPLDRKGMASLMEDAKDKKFDAVVFYCLDRLAREIIITFSIINDFKSYGVEIISCEEDIDTNTYQGKFKLSIYAAINELELNTIKARLEMGREMKRQKDGDVGGRLPYGYSRVNNQIAIKPEQALIIRGIFHAYYSDRLSMNKIAAILTEQKIKTARGGKKWYASTIKSIIDNREKYEGGLINNNNNDICWPQILVNRYMVENK